MQSDSRHRIKVDVELRQLCLWPGPHDETLREQ